LTPAGCSHTITGMGISFKNPTFRVIFLLLLVSVAIPLAFYLFKGQLLSGLSSLSGKSNPQKADSSTISSIPSQPSLPKIIACPVPGEFCQKGKILEFSLPGGRKKYDGLGWTLPENTVIKAAFDGIFKEQETYGATPSPRLVTLTSKDEKYEARYLFTPATKLSVTEEKTFGKGVEVKSGDVLSIIPGAALRDYKANLKFVVVEKKTDKTLPLKTEDLGKFSLE